MIEYSRLFAFSFCRDIPSPNTPDDGLCGPSGTFSDFEAKEEVYTCGFLTEDEVHKRDGFQSGHGGTHDKRCDFCLLIAVSPINSIHLIGMKAKCFSANLSIKGIFHDILQPT
ncbi:hypothetical protein STEG23_011703 [Scotinomys teguina]